MQKLCEGDALVSVIDERGELMACEAGSLPRAAQIRCDVYARCTKAEGIAMALRCMNPQVIVCDELGTPGDAEAVAQGVASGVVFFATVHCDDPAGLRKKPALAALLDKPNNNLAVEYCKAILEQEAPMTPVPLPRRGANHGQTLEESGHAQFASASALRALWAEGGAEAVAPFVPEKAFDLYKTAENDGAYTDFDAAGRCELALLRAACAKPEPFAAVRGVSEGLEHRLEHAVRQSTSLPQLLDALTTVRYPRARMRRLAMDAALDYTADTVPALPPALHLLGARKDALPLLGQVSLPVSHSLAKLAQAGPDGARMAAAQAAASDFGALCRANPAPMGGIYRQKNIFLTN